MPMWFDEVVDLIGSTRTESLPPGFLRSMKIKYRHERSKVFPPGTPYVKDPETKPQENMADTADRSKSVGAVSLAPSFMNWRVPSRLIQGHTRSAVKFEDKPSPKPSTHKFPKTSWPGKKDKDDDNASEISGVSQHPLSREGSPAQPSSRQQSLPPSRQRSLPPSRQRSLPLSRRRSLPPSRSPRIKSREKPAVPQLPRLGCSQSDRSVNKNITTSQSIVKNNIKDSALPALKNWMETANTEEKRVVAEVLQAATRDTKLKENIGVTVNSKAISSVEKWLDAADGKDREIAERFFTTLTKKEEPAGNCEGEQEEGIPEINMVLDKDKKKLQNMMDGIHSMAIRGKYSYHRKPMRIPEHIRRRFQTWHHMPIYPFNDCVNPSAMFTTPHKIIHSDFTIHPEWGYHTIPLKLPAK